MVVRYCALFTLLVLFCSSAQSFAETSCLSIIKGPSVFSKVLTAAETSQKLILLPHSAPYAEDVMNSLALTSESDRLVFNNAIKLRPVLDTEVLYAAIAAEAVIRKYHSASDVKSMLNNFSLFSVKEKDAIVYGILESILFSIQLDSNRILGLKKLAARFNMSEADLVDLIKALDDSQKVNYDDVKIVILDFLRSPSPTLIKSVTNYPRRKFTGFGWFQQQYPIRYEGHFFEENGSDFTPWLYNEDARLIQYSNMETRVRFIRKHVDLFQQKQLNDLLASSLWSAIPEDLQKIILNRTALLALEDQLVTATEKLNKVTMLAETDPAKKILSEYVIKEISGVNEYKDPEKAVKRILEPYPSQLLPDDATRVVKLVISKLIYISDNELFLESIRLALPAKLIENMRSENYLDVVLLVLDSAKGRFPTYGYSPYKFLYWIIEQSKLNANLTLQDGSIIQSKLRQINPSSHRGGHEYEKFNQSLVVPLGRDPSIILDAEALKNEIAELKAKIAVYQQ